MAVFKELPLEILKKLSFLVDIETNKSLLLSCKKCNCIGYNVYVINKFIENYLKPLESIPVVFNTEINDKYFKIVNSFFKYLVKYKPHIQYAKKKYTLLYNAILLNNCHFFNFVCTHLSFFPSTICFNSLNIASRVGLVEAFDFFFTHLNLILSNEINKNDSFILEKDYFNFFLNACHGGHINIIKKLFSMSKIEQNNNNNSNIKINEINTISHSNIAFDTACENGHEEIVKFLINRKEMNNIKNWNNAMIKSINNNHFNVALILVNESNKRNSILLSNNVRNCGFKIAIKNNNCTLVNALLNNPLSISQINWSFAIKNALINENTELLHILLESVSKLDNRNELISVNTLNLIMKLAIKTSDFNLVQLINKINNVNSRLLNQDNEIIEMILNKTNSSIIIEKLIYIFVLKYNNKVSLDQYQILLNNFQIYYNISDNEAMMTNMSINKICNDNKIIEQQYKKLNAKISINDYINLMNSRNNEPKLFSKRNETLNISNKNNIIDDIDRAYKEMRVENEPNENKLSTGQFIVNNNFNKNEFNNNNKIENKEVMHSLKVNSINWTELTREEKTVDLTKNIWCKCVSLSIIEHRYYFLYYLLYSYNPKYTSLLSTSSWNKIINVLLSSSQINIFSKICNIKRNDIMLSSENLNLLIKMMVRQGDKNENILLNLTDQELNLLSKDNLNLIFHYATEQNIIFFIEKLLQYRYKDIITKENKDFCLRKLIQSNNIKLFKLLLLQDKSICTTKNINYVYNYGSQEMKCFINSI
ncbi:hypothetical protein U3516DRAFT_625221 [Neocallimastix sp. 'constans']